MISPSVTSWKCDIYSKRGCRIARLFTKFWSVCRRMLILYILMFYLSHDTIKHSISQALVQLCLYLKFHAQMKGKYEKNTARYGDFAYIYTLPSNNLKLMIFLNIFFLFFFHIGEAPCYLFYEKFILTVFWHRIYLTSALNS